MGRAEDYKRRLQGFNNARERIAGLEQQLAAANAEIARMKEESQGLDIPFLIRDRDEWKAACEIAWDKGFAQEEREKRKAEALRVAREALETGKRTCRGHVQLMMTIKEYDTAIAVIDAAGGGK